MFGRRSRPRLGCLLVPIRTLEQERRERRRLQAALMLTLRGFNDQLVQQFVQVLSIGGTPNAQGVDAAFAILLLGHYREVAEAFQGRVAQGLPPDVQATEAEQAAIALAVTQFGDARAPVQAGAITRTTQRNFNDAIARAREDAFLRNSAGEAVGVAGFARTAGLFLRRSLRGREPLISSLETNAPAETDRLLEVQGLAGAAVSQLTKTWIHPEGPQEHRGTHIAADHQTVSVNAPFIVDGEQLSVPRDTSLGASIGNVANCHCDVVYSVAKLVDIRRQRRVLN